MIVPVTQKLTEIQNNIEQIQNIITKDPYKLTEKDIVFLLQLSSETETALMDFTLFFKRLDKIKEIKELLSNKYINELLPQCNKILKGNKDESRD